MSGVERICKENGKEDVLFYPYGIYGEQEELVKCNHGKGTSTANNKRIVCDELDQTVQTNQE